MEGNYFAKTAGSSRLLMQALSKMPLPAPPFTLQLPKNAAVGRSRFSPSA
ncbi:hypothetical protein OHAE_1331 [Ochrobactrum soli]|uniref:Uncharacterized protein n=1 Tax=Ochrobactrum soli TaxID=2448455 RepID=A0A2P9HN16_9HYPH|nr:hypothetical protein OHAE_1331 [[Ochrobactrum] soli]